jgi:hypothetical protein
MYQFTLGQQIANASPMHCQGDLASRAHIQVNGPMNKM